MKRNLLIAVLTTGIAGVAHSATSVTLYGLVDAGIGYQQTRVSQGDQWNKTREIGVVNGVNKGNRWGLKGAEDIGNGTSAIFQLENGFDLGNGNATIGGRLFGRQAFVGLQSKSWGALTFGRQYNLAAKFIASIDPFAVGFKQAGVLNGAFGSSTNARMDNSIKYVSPELSGFTFGMVYAGKNTKTTTGDGMDDVHSGDTSNWISLGANYAKGPLVIGASYDRFRTNFREAGEETKGTAHMWNLFGSYDFDLVKLHLGYGQVHGAASNDIVVEKGPGSTGLNGAFNKFTVVKDPVSSIHGLDYAQTDGYRQQAWLVGLTTPVGDQGKILFSYQGSATKNTEDAFDGAKGRLDIYSLAYLHNMSKRTSLYAVASYGSGRLKFDNQENVRLKSTLVGIGIHHLF
ncbi:porin [Advenella sp. S44]|uniref:porin n=1 Tax=Advenella sp. S44 TaxID=1982755 RepID=UPI000C2B08C9|nr:porin [Advenella sp. S44]PJX20496.1 porin [Advenella sp. S44]